MAMKITTDVVAGDTALQVRTKLTAIIDAWHGSGVAAGETTWGGWRTRLNAIATAFGKSTFADGESFASFLPKINILNDAQQVMQPVAVEWWSADRADLLTLVGSAVSGIAGIYAGASLTQGLGSSRPAYGATSFNGMPGITFDGSDDVLEGVVSGLPVGASPGGLFSVAENKRLVGNTAAYLLFGYGVGNTRRMLGRVVAGGANVLTVNTDNAGGAVAVQTTTPAWDGRAALKGMIGATTASVAIDGNTPVSSAVVSGTINTRVRLGSNVNTSPSGYAEAQVRDAILTGAVTTDQEVFITNYTKSRRAL